MLIDSHSGQFFLLKSQLLFRTTLVPACRYLEKSIVFLSVNIILELITSQFFLRINNLRITSSTPHFKHGALPYFQKNLRLRRELWKMRKQQILKKRVPQRKQKQRDQENKKSQKNLVNQHRLFVIGCCIISLT